MCQMPNIWHICHTKHQKSLLSDVPNPIKFTTCEQYRCKFATVRTRMLKKKRKFFIHSLSSFFTFSLLSLSFSFFFLCHSISVTLFSSFLVLSPEASLPLDFSSLALFHESRHNCSQKIIFLDINYFFNFSGFCGVEESGGWFQICLLELIEYGVCCLDWTKKKGMFSCFWISALLGFDILLLLLGVHVLFYMLRSLLIVRERLFWAWNIDLVLI